MKRILIFIIALTIASCEKEGRPEKSGGESKVNVASVNYPLHYFAQRIGGDVIEAVYPVSPEGDPAYWQPDADAIALFQSADVILLNGADYAKWIKKVSLPVSKIVNTSKAFENDYIELKEGTTHSHGPEGKHEHIGYAFTTWLNFKYAVKQAEAVKDALAKTLPDSKEFFENNFNGLKKELEKLDADISVLSSKLNGITLYASHPVYQYMAAEYNLNIISEHWEPDQAPTQEQWVDFHEKLLDNPAALMLWEDEPQPEVEKKLNDIGVRVCVFNPCGNIPAEGEFTSNMTENMSRFEALVR